jgi:DNA-binding HxlR family transcriptional regulator
MRSGFGQFCPVAVACEVFAERWTPMILRELSSGSEHFNDIHRGVPLMSRALLVRRLRELEDAGVIARTQTAGKRRYRYTLTPAGEEFRPVLEALGRWGQRWTVRVQQKNLDAAFLVWNIRRRIDRERLPERRVVVCLRFSGNPHAYRGPRVFWLLLERTAVEVCIEDPGVETDVLVEADVAAMTAVWLGDISFEQALRSKGLRVMGPRRLASAFPTWLMLSRFANVARPGSDSAGRVVTSAFGATRQEQPGV